MNSTGKHKRIYEETFVTAWANQQSKDRPIGAIPVGEIVASEAIHPGMHSADICCSMAISILPGVASHELLDAVHAVTHFGPGGRPSGAQLKPSDQRLQISKRTHIGTRLQVSLLNILPRKMTAIILLMSGR